ncbi:MAG: InlB B-repeat-containing protein [Alphaproteobacteria bacterium]|nr:InlB B-repeat-containing protein [Alphaproteobacteria bacterium]
MKKFFVALFMLLTIPAFATGVGSGASTADCKYAPLETYSGTSNLQADWEANTIQLHWYNGDTEITSGVPTSCTYDGSLIPPSTIPTRTGYTFKGWTVRGLPAGYTRLQYIESTGTQYIDTGVYANQNTEVRTKFANRAAAGESTTRVVIGDTYQSEGYVLSITANTRSYIRIGMLSVLFNDYWQTGKVYDVYMSKNSDLQVNDEIFSWTGSENTFSSTQQLRLFGVVDASNRYAIINMYGLRILEGDVLIRDFIPAKRNSDNVVGMWDTVSKTFFTNAGTGSFIAGPVVQ